VGTVYQIPGRTYLAGKNITFDVNPVKRLFYAACNSILNHSSNLEELVQLKLQELYSLPILTYSIAALELKAKQLTELNVCWNSVYRRLFGFHRWESVRGCINGLGRLDFLHVCQLAKVKYYLKISNSADSVLHGVFWAYSGYSFTKDGLCSCIFKGRRAAVAEMFADFEAQTAQ